MRYLIAEARKLLGLRAAGVGLALTVALPALLTWLNGNDVRRTAEAGGEMLPGSVLGLDESMIGLIGIVIVAVLGASSEFTRAPAALGRGRQVSTTLLAEPNRLGLGLAKIGVLVAWVGAVSAVEIGGALWVARVTAGDQATPPGTQAVWAVIGYNLTVALLAHGMAAVLRSAVVPLVVGILNAGVVSFSLLLAGVTPVVRFLPDMALVALTGTPSPIHLTFPLLPTTVAAWVLVGWAALGGAAALLAWRRDA